MVLQGKEDEGGWRNASRIAGEIRAELGQQA